MRREGFLRANNYIFLLFVNFYARHSKTAGQISKLFDTLIFNINLFRSLTQEIRYKSIQLALGSTPWVENVFIRRHTTVLTLRIRSRHILLIIFLMERSNTPKCQMCNIEEDVFHIFLKCACKTTNIQIQLQYRYKQQKTASRTSKESKLIYDLVEICIGLRN